MTLEKETRAIRSYVLRQGRMTPAQKRGMTESWTRYGLTIPVENKGLDWCQIFGREAPTFLEIGFGMGESLLALASTHPEKNFIGIEVHQPGVGGCLWSAQKLGLENLRVFREDAKKVLQECIPDGSLDKIFLLFPDPWPKRKHHKRRLVQPDFVALIARKLKKGGIFHLATDWQPYAEQMITVLEACPALSNMFGPGNVAPPLTVARIETKFERRGQKLGYVISDLLYTRVL